MTRVSPTTATRAGDGARRFDNRVTQIKSAAPTLHAVQVLSAKRRARASNKAAAGHLAKAAVEAGHVLREFRVLERPGKFQARRQGRSRHLKVDRSSTYPAARRARLRPA